MPGLLDSVDPDGLLEYSVVYTDRAVNHMAVRFQQAMRDIHSTLCSVYRAEHAVIVPGSGSFAMEAVARQFARGQHCLVIRNGWFSYRWSQILDTSGIASGVTVMSAEAAGDSDEGGQLSYAPASVDEVCARIAAERPGVVFAPHVETSAGMQLSDDYIQAVAEAAHAVGALLVLDCIASGTTWIDMQECGVDVLVSAPQKGWSASPCAGLAMLSERAVAQLATTNSDSFALDLAKWSSIMRTYLDGKHAYHATMPTDSLLVFRDTMKEMSEFGFEVLKARQAELGMRIRGAFDERGFKSVAASGWHASGVAVFHTDDDGLHTGKAFAEQGVQIAAGVPLQIGEPANYKSFRIGLFGIDKLKDVDAAVERFGQALARIESVNTSGTARAPVMA